MRIQLSLVAAALYCAFPSIFAQADSNVEVRSLKVSKDGRCGGYTGQTCDGSVFGNCCNKDGWCGKSASCCGAGCQKSFGTCAAEMSMDGRCGKNGKSCMGSKWGECCNKDGLCGKSDGCCGKGCQTSFGKCASSTTSSEKTSTMKSTARASSVKASSATKTSKSSVQVYSTPQTSSTKASSTTKKSSSSSISAYSIPKTPSSSVKTSSTSKKISSSISNKLSSTSKSSTSSSVKTSSTSTKLAFLSSIKASSVASSSAPSFVASRSVSSSIAGSSASSSESSSSMPSSAGSSSVSSSVASSSMSSESQSSSSSSDVSTTPVSSSGSDTSSTLSQTTDTSSTETYSFASTFTNFIPPDATGTSAGSTTESASPTSTDVAPTATPPPCPDTDGSCLTVSGSSYLITCGTDYFGASNKYSPQEIDTLDACVAACDDIPACVAVTWVASTNGGPSFCYLKNTITDSASNSWVHGARKVDASECPVTPASSSDSAAATTTDSIDAATTELASATTTDFDEAAFLATYTYYEVPLPTFDSEVDIPVNGIEPAPSQICFADPTDNSMQFEVLDTRGYPITDNGGKLGLPATPPTNTTVYPYYHFETPDGAPAGFQDLVYEANDGYKYAALKDDGSVVLVDASTNGGKAEDYQTTVFTIECDGRMAMGTPSTHYVWALDGDFTKATAGTGHSSIILLPRAASMTITPKSIHTRNTNNMKARRSSKEGRMNTSKRSFYNEGQSPRCANTPPELVAQVLTKEQGGRDAQANGCGSAGIGGYLVPDYKFTPCCNTHDLCYDNCVNGKKENCDSQFGQCMHNICSQIPWYEFLDVYACPRIADFYEWFVETWGNSAFSSANKERCGCFCPHRYDNSAPENDSFNCGGCGNTCPDKTHCKSSKCVCNQDTCNGNCVDVQSHPKNCGACGNVCASGICKDGACYTPKAVAITNKCPADKVWNSMGRVFYYSIYGYGNTIGDVRDQRGDSDAEYYGAPARFSLNNHGLGFSKTDCCDTCYSMGDCIAFYLQEQYGETYCWTMNQETVDTYFTNVFDPPKKMCQYGGFYLDSEAYGSGALDNGWSDSIVEWGPCWHGNGS